MAGATGTWAPDELEDPEELEELEDPEELEELEELDDPEELEELEDPLLLSDPPPPPQETNINAATAIQSILEITTNSRSPS